MTKSKSFIIDDESALKLTDKLNPPGMGHGLVTRDYNAYPVEMFAPPTKIKLIPRSDWDAMIKEQEEMQSSLEHLRPKMANGKHFESLDQNGQGYCWFYSVTGTVMWVRAANGQPYKRLSAHAGACKVKNFRDEGGWCGLGADFIRNNGVPTIEKWPEKSMSRSNDNPETWKDAAKYKIVEDWVDLTRPVYDQNLTFDMVATCLLLNIPCAVDFNWWAHSVCAIRLVRIEAGSYGLRIINSWTDGWGIKGIGDLRGSKAIPDGAVATTAVTPSGHMAKSKSKKVSIGRKGSMAC